MSGTLARAEILPMTRPDRGRSWVRTAHDGAEDETLDEEPGHQRHLADDDLTPIEADEGDDLDGAAELDGPAAPHLTRTRQAGAGTAQTAALTAAPTAASTAVAAVTDDSTLAGWIERIAHQDQRALESLYDATSARVHGVVLRITQRAALAEEVVEETYWQVWRQAPRFDAARGRPITWLLAMARSRAIDMLRREQRFQHDDLPDDDAADAAQAAPPPQDLLEAARGQAHVHAALASLEPRARQLVSLAFFRGLTHEEIAEQQAMPLGTVKSLIRRALQQLKRVMEAEHA